jgi:hypothetical protein
MPHRGCHFLNSMTIVEVVAVMISTVYLDFLIEDRDSRKGHG